MYDRGPRWNPAERKGTQPKPSGAGPVGRGERTERADIRRQPDGAKRSFFRREEEQGSERSFRRQPETESADFATTTRCELCFRRCALDEGQTGSCRARGRRDGRIVPLNYGKLTSLALDPIEKKPLRRFHPGSRILSAGSFGCNLRCPFCQNHAISMAEDGEIQAAAASPEQLADKAAELVPQGNIGLAYTYNEPLVGYEYVRDCAAAVHERGLVNVLVTNGTVEEAPWRALLPLIDAANIDLKGFTAPWYRKLGGDLDTVKRSIALAAGQCHLEVTTLLVPGENDSVEEIRELARWLAAVDPNLPLHLSRFFPRYRMTDRPPTPIQRVRRLAEEAGAYLTYVYTGNC